MILDLFDVRSAFPELADVTPLGAGGGGQKFVFRASAAGHPVVLKLLKASGASSHATVAAQRADREVLASVKLQSSFVPRVLDAGERPVGGDDRTFIIEEFVEGTTLRDILRAQPVRDRVEVCELLRSLVLAAADFASANLVHRDIKPENLILGADGRLWVIDFGLVRFLDLDSLTADAAILGVGTWGYAAPEQQGNRKAEIDIRADLFSIGVVAYEMLAGVNPFLQNKRDLLQVLLHVRNQDLPALPHNDDPGRLLSEFVSLMVGRYASRRPPTAAHAIAWFAPVYERVTGKTW